VPDAREALARALHEAYVRQRLAAGQRLGSTGALTPWDELPEEFRESTRLSSDVLAAALREVGYVVADSTSGTPDATLTEDDVETIAVRLHGRWVEERLARGWRPGPSRDDGSRTHPDLVPWYELPDERREIDRALVRSFPEALQAAGSRLAPTSADRGGPGIDGMRGE
jgi:hypothetical protein